MHWPCMQHAQKYGCYSQTRGQFLTASLCTVKCLALLSKFLMFPDMKKRLRLVFSKVEGIGMFKELVGNIDAFVLDFVLNSTTASGSDVTMLFGYCVFANSCYMQGSIS